MKRVYSFMTSRMRRSEHDIHSLVGLDKMLVHKEPENVTVHCHQILCMCREYVQWNTWNDVSQGFESVHKSREDTEVCTCSGWLQITSNLELLDKVCHLQVQKKKPWLNVQNEGEWTEGEWSQLGWRIWQGWALKEFMRWLCHTVCAARKNSDNWILARGFFFLEEADSEPFSQV